MRELALIHWVYKGRYIDELADVAKDYKSKESDNLKPATIRNRLAYLRAACRYAFRVYGVCDHDPAERLQLPRPKNDRHFYLDRKSMLVIARKITGKEPALTRKYRAAIRIAFYSGMRLSELLRCTYENGNLVLADTKNGDRRLVPLHNKIKSCLKYFPLNTPKRTIQKRFEIARNAVGLEHIHLHDLRHSAASEMINNGIDLYTVGGVLGHRSAESTKRYAHLATTTLANAVSKIGQKMHIKTKK